jgi:hypothetical protein
MPMLVASLPVCYHSSSYINYYNTLTKWIVVGLPCDFFIWIVAKKIGLLLLVGGCDYSLKRLNQGLLLMDL